LMQKQSNDDLADFELDDSYQECLDAFHDMDEENYEYDEKKNEGYMTFQLAAQDLRSNEPYKVLFSMKISGREVTMLFSFVLDPDANLKKLGKVYEKLDLNNPLETEMHGVDESSSKEDLHRRVTDPDELLKFFTTYYIVSAKAAAYRGVGVVRWNGNTLPLVRYPDHAAWVLFEYEDPQDYLDDLQS
ncbi:MAG: hypothetical protein J6Y58_10790, partial [Clostridiales bacterium]|nr:hypothetical protein [Clostridiales bacterium]